MKLPEAFIINIVLGNVVDCSSSYLFHRRACRAAMRQTGPNVVGVK
jgi:hypothetical protein